MYYTYSYKGQPQHLEWTKNHLTDHFLEIFRGKLLSEIRVELKNYEFFEVAKTPVKADFGLLFGASK